MNGNCHFILGMGVAAAAIITTEPNIDMATGLASMTLLGSIFPDIDNPNSHFGQLTKPVSSVICSIGEKFGKKGSNHRGIFHDIVLYGVGLFLCIYFNLALRWFFIGALSHLFLDCMNPAGIPIILGMGKFRILKFKSGDIGSIILTWITTFLVVFGACYFKYLM